MSEQRLRTRLTELFGIRHPILAGGLMWLSDATYVAAVVNAGGMAFMTPRSFDGLDAFRAQLRRCAELTGGKPFGVNLGLSARMGANAQVPLQLETALAEGVRFFETVGPSPGPLFETIHAAGGTVIHKASFVAHALKAEKQGADAVALVGMEAGGHPGLHDLPSTLLGAEALQHLRVPLAIGGGIGSGRQIAAALALGADAVVIGTRFLVCEEIWAHRRYKEHLLTRGSADSVVGMRSAGAPWRVLDNTTAREVLALEAAGARRHEEFGELALGRYGRDHAYESGDWARGMLSMGPGIAFADRIEPVADIVDRLIDDAVLGARRLATLQRVDHPAH